VTKGKLDRVRKKLKKRQVTGVTRQTLRLVWIDTVMLSDLAEKKTFYSLLTHILVRLN
jgi:hypothetical protein